MSRTYFDTHARLNHRFLHPGSSAATESLLYWIASLRPAPTRIVEPGCGTGATARMALERFPDLHYTLLDRSSGMLARATRSVERFGNRVEVICSDLCQPLPFTSGSFDLVIFESVAAICDSRHLINESSRLLAPGGHIWFNERIWNAGSTSAERDAVNRRSVELFGFPAADPSLPGTESWIAALREAGFTSVASRLVPPAAHSNLSRISRVLSNLPAYLSGESARLLRTERLIAEEFPGPMLAMEQVIITARKLR